MSDDQERRDEALAPQSTRGLITRSMRLVRRGLDDLVEREEADSWDAENLAELKRLARELIFDAINSIGMEFVLIPAGKFMMGSDTRDDEKPIHEITISNPFYMARHPVSQSQWREIMGAEPLEFTGDDDSVHGVSWDDAHEFISKLNLLDEPAHLLVETNGESRPKVQFEYRLPSEAEWEYACRAGLKGDVTSVPTLKFM